MKNYIKKGLLALTVAGVFSSCSSDYLDQPPIDQISDYQIGESIEAARAALYGTCQVMYFGLYRQYDRFANGEAYLQTYYGDSPSQDAAYTWLYGYQEQMQLWPQMNIDNRTCSAYGWMYGYLLANQCNTILKYIDNNTENVPQRDFIKAQTLTIRAHAYIRLMQIYGPRYEDSKNGQELCLILRTEPGTDPMPLSTYEDCMKQIYSDLDEAIGYYTGTAAGVTRTNGFEPDLSIAQGLYSRIALINHDWQKAYDMAKAARASYPIMSADEYRQGFADANGEWMWYNDISSDWNGYYSWGASFSANGDYATAYDWAGAGAISYKFYKEMYDKHPNDIRCELFFTPETANMYVDVKVKPENFWSSEYVFSDRMTCFGTNQNMSAAAQVWIQHNTPEGFNGGYALNTPLSDSDAASTIRRSSWYKNAIKNVEGTRVPFGGQAKFWSYLEEMGGSQHPFLRGAEMLLNQAEAAIELGNLSEAKTLMEELNSKRIEGYTCTASSKDDIQDEVRKYRRFELWGEGDNWFSFKRWNIPCVREVWVEGDVTSNNWVKYYKGTYLPSQYNGWRYAIPYAETSYNDYVKDQLK